MKENICVYVYVPRCCRYPNPFDKSSFVTTELLLRGQGDG